MWRQSLLAHRKNNVEPSSPERVCISLKYTPVWLHFLQWTVDMIKTWLEWLFYLFEDCSVGKYALVGLQKQHRKDAIVPRHFRETEMPEMERKHDQIIVIFEWHEKIPTPERGGKYWDPTEKKNENENELEESSAVKACSASVTSIFLGFKCTDLTISLSILWR